MAPMKHNHNYSTSSTNGEDIVRRANVLASCYLVDPSATSLKGLHYCTTGVTADCQPPQEPSGIPEAPSSELPSPPSSPPLAAITSTNQLALQPKAKANNSSNGRGNNARRRNLSRRGGAALRIREECERFFCETLRTLFLGERGSATYVSRLAGVHINNSNNQSDHKVATTRGSDEGSKTSASLSSISSRGLLETSDSYFGPYGQLTPPADYSFGLLNDRSCSISAWMEMWDYAGGASFRAFLSEKSDAGDKSLFVFFDVNILGRDLKKGLVALIELAEGPMECVHMIICVERQMANEDSHALVRGLQWAGFSPTTLDFWAPGSGLDVTSPRWIFMGMKL